MISIKSKYNTYWFSKSVNIIHAFGLNNYRQCQETKNQFGFAKKISYTKTIDLIKIKNNPLQILSKDTQYEIRRATKEGITFLIDSDIKSFVEFYNNSINQSKLEPLNYASLIPSITYLLVSKAILDSNCLVSHIYICDRDEKRARLLYSVSKSTTNNHEKKTIGFANRFLHFADIKYFIEENYNTYDVGGYAYNTKDPKLININKFKDEFSETLVCEGNYKSYLFLLAQKIKEIINK